METKQIQNLLSKDTQVTIDGVTVGLIIEDDGKAELVVFRDDKQLKSIPPKIKKIKLLSNWEITVKSCVSNGRVPEKGWKKP